MRIERHQVDEAAIAAVREDFADRIGGQAWSMSKAGPVTAYEWWTLSEALVEYLAALSVETPALHTVEAKQVLDDAAEAAAGAIAYSVYYGYDRFRVFLDYVNFGMSYDPDRDHEPHDRPAPATAHQWLDAFCLAFIARKLERHGEAFHFAREEPLKGGAGHPPVELINGFMAYVLGDTGDDDANFPATRPEKLAALDAALTRIQALNDTTDTTNTTDGQGLLDRPQTTALHALRALAAQDKEAFRTALAQLLHPYSTLAAATALPSDLLPLLPLTLTALAYRKEGWPPLIDTDYLPHALVTGFE